MNRVDRSRRKHSSGTGLSLVFMFLGIGLISWALLNICTQSGYSKEVPSSSYSTPANLNTLLGNNTAALSSSNPQDDKKLYPVYPVEGESIGILIIPVLNRKLPIFEGTGVKELNKGVGHFSQSVLPGEKDNCVLSGHRETAFTKVGVVKIGDELIVQTSGGTFTYEVSGTRIVHKDDKTVIVPTDHAVLTLTTCYPFNYLGNAPDRYIISANLVKSE